MRSSHRRRATRAISTADNTARTGSHLEGRADPRLPHEHDESSDSQASAPRAEMKRAWKDAERGVPDTDKSVPMNELYNRTLRSEPSPSDSDEPSSR